MFKLINFKFRRYLAQSNGWEPNWDRYKQWLKDRKFKENKRMIEAAAAKERKEHNDKVLVMCGLGPKKPTQHKKWWED